MYLAFLTCFFCVVQGFYWSLQTDERRERGSAALGNVKSLKAILFPECASDWHGTVRSGES